MFILQAVAQQAVAQQVSPVPNGWTVLIAAVGIVPGIMAAILAYLAHATGQRNADAIHVVHLAVNSRLDELLRANKDLSHAQGLAEGRATGVIGELKITPIIPPIAATIIPPKT